MKKYCIATLFIGVALLLVACGGQKASNVLNLYAWSEYVPQALLDDFTAQTGIKVNYDTYSSKHQHLSFYQIRFFIIPQELQHLLIL